MPNIDTLDFLNLNALRNFPIKEGLSRTDVDGVFIIPNNFLVDAQLGVTYNPARSFYISSIANLDDEITVIISDDEDTQVGSFVIDTQTHTRYNTYELIPSVDYVGGTGVITVGALEGMSSSATGTFTFTADTATLEMRVSIPALRGINRMIFINADGSEFALTGDVEIEARTNLRFKAGIGNRVILDAGEDLGLNTVCDELQACIKTINGIPPDEDGNFTLDFSDCATLTPIPANTGLMLEDTCCQPCVGCNDIAELTQRVMVAENALIQLRNYYTNLDVLYNQFKTTVTYSCDCPPST